MGKRWRFSKGAEGSAEGGLRVEDMVMVMDWKFDTSRVGLQERCKKRVAVLGAVNDCRRPLGVGASPFGAVFAFLTHSPSSQSLPNPPLLPNWGSSTTWWRSSQPSRRAPAPSAGHLSTEELIMTVLLWAKQLQGWRRAVAPVRHSQCPGMVHERAGEGGSKDACELARGFGARSRLRTRELEG